MMGIHQRLSHLEAQAQSVPCVECGRDAAGKLTRLPPWRLVDGQFVQERLPDPCPACGRAAPVFNAITFDGDRMIAADVEGI
jgi:endogenous inhibitor of DNA gyrase (YacG/DUF329 family)